ncbi:MAG: porin [Dokdonella sp.]
MHTRNVRTLLAIAMLVTAPLAHADFSLGEILGYSVTFEGLVQADRTQYDADVTPLVDDGEVRRAELVLKGKKGNFDWVVGYDVSTRNDKFLDVNGRYKFNSKFSARVGQYKQANSLEELSSTKNNDFIVKAMATQAFAVSRRQGASLAWQESKWLLTGGWFGREITDGGGTGAGYGGRFTYTPILEDGNIIHLGVSAISYDTNDDRDRIRARPGFDISTTPRLIDSGTFRDADKRTTYGLEAGWVRGPFKLQAEYFDSTVDRLSHPDYNADSWYVSGLWNISGETWGYKDGVFATNHPVHKTGMWQVGVRYERLNLNDGLVRGGEEKNFAVGVNYYALRNFKLSLNYVRANATKGSGISDQPNAIEGRAQLFW